MYALLLSVTALAPRVAVFGGSGFVGSRVCKTLVDSGCSVLSVSRAGQPPSWAAAEPWSKNVEWLSADMLAEERITLPLGRLDGAVSCVGNLRPSPEWEEFFGLHWDTPTMVRENGLINERIAEAAQQAGARRFSLVSVSSLSMFAFYGAIEGYIDGKLNAQAAVRQRFGDGACLVGPSLIYGGGRFPFLKLQEASLGSAISPAKAYIALIRALKASASTGFVPQDAATEVSLTPPVQVDLVARAVAAGVLGAVEDPSRLEQAEMVLPDGSAKVPCPDDLIDGSAGITKAAELFGTPEKLAAAARAFAASSDGGEGGAGAVTVDAAPKPEVPQSPSAFGTAAEGGLYGQKPWLFPWPPGIALVGFFVGAILYQ